MNTDSKIKSENARMFQIYENMKIENGKMRLVIRKYFYIRNNSVFRIRRRISKTINYKKGRLHDDWRFFHARCSSVL